MVVFDIDRALTSNLDVGARGGGRRYSSFPAIFSVLCLAICARSHCNTAQSGTSTDRLHGSGRRPNFFPPLFEYLVWPSLPPCVGSCWLFLSCLALFFSIAAESLSLRHHCRRRVADVDARRLVLAVLLPAHPDRAIKPWRFNYGLR